MQYYFNMDSENCKQNFSKNHHVFQWLNHEKLKGFSCFIEFSWNDGLQSDFMLISKNKIINLEVKNWKGVIKGGLENNWSIEDKNMGINPIGQSIRTANSFKNYVAKTLKIDDYKSPIRVYPVVVLPLASEDSAIPQKGSGGFGSVVFNKEELINIIDNLRKNQHEISPGDVLSFVRTLNLQPISSPELTEIIDNYRDFHDNDEMDAFDNYVTDTPVSGSKFFGRSKELKDLMKSILRGDHVAIIGSQRTGKSSLVRELKNEGTRLFKDIASKLDETLFIEIDFQGVGSAATITEFENRFKRGIIDALKKDYVKAHRETIDDISGKIEKINFNSNLTEFLRKYFIPFMWDKFKFGRVVFFFDEFSELLETIHSNAKSTHERGDLVNIEMMRFISNLMKNKDLKRSIVYVLALRPFTQHYHDKYDLQIFKCIGTTIGLDYFDFKTTEQLVKTPVEHNIEYTEEAINEIYKLTSGHPWFTSLFCKELCRKIDLDTNRKTKIDDNIINDLANEMTSNEKAFQYNAYFTVLEGDFTLDSDEIDIGKQIIALIAIIKSTQDVWPTFNDIFTKYSEIKEIEKSKLSKVLIKMVNTKIIIEAKGKTLEPEYQIRMGIIYKKYINQNLYSRYFR